MQFQWDENKNTIHIEKHGISFEEAGTVFEGIFSDDGHGRRKGQIAGQTGAVGESEVSNGLKTF